MAPLAMCFYPTLVRDKPLKSARICKTRLLSESFQTSRVPSLKLRFHTIVQVSGKQLWSYGQVYFMDVAGADNKTTALQSTTKPCAYLTNWGPVTHICVSKRTVIGSDNGLLPIRRQAIIWTNVGILLIGPSGTIFSENLVEIDTFSFTKMHLKMSFGKWWPCYLGLNVLMRWLVFVIMLLWIMKIPGADTAKRMVGDGF